MSLQVFSGWHNYMLVETGVLNHYMYLYEHDWVKVSGVNDLTLVHVLWDITLRLWGLIYK